MLVFPVFRIRFSSVSRIRKRNGSATLVLIVQVDSINQSINQSINDGSGPAQDFSNPTTPINYDIGYGGVMGYNEDTNDMEFDVNDINITDILNITTNMYPDQINQAM